MKKNIFYCIILMCFSIENSFAQTTTTPPSEQIGEIRILTDEDVKQNELRKAEDKKILEESNRILLEKKAKEALKEII